MKDEQRFECQGVATRGNVLHRYNHISTLPERIFEEYVDSPDYDTGITIQEFVDMRYTAEDIREMIDEELDLDKKKREEEWII